MRWCRQGEREGGGRATSPRTRGWLASLCAQPCQWRRGLGPATRPGRARLMPFPRSIAPPPRRSTPSLPSFLTFLRVLPCVWQLLTAGALETNVVKVGQRKGGEREPGPPIPRRAPPNPIFSMSNHAPPPPANPLSGHFQRSGPGAGRPSVGAGVGRARGGDLCGRRERGGVGDHAAGRLRRLRAQRVRQRRGQDHVSWF